MKLHHCDLRCKLALLLVHLICASHLAKRVSAAELSSASVAQINTRVARELSERPIPGLSLAIARDGDLVYEQGYGQADIENYVPATPQTIYRLASISKMLTAVAAMQLVERGKLDLDAPIQKYVPGFPDKGVKITAEHLLKHQSGIRHYKGREASSALPYAHVKDALAIFKDEPLLFSPGEKFSYTTYGYNLLGAAIEGASGQDYVGYVREHVCTPAGMATIEPDSPYRIIAHRAAGYQLRDTPNGPQLANDEMVDISNKIPGGGWCSTASDLARFATALMDGRLARRETLERMWTAQKTSDGKPTQSGLGCFVDSGSHGRRISHSGGQPKVSTYLVFSPEKRVAVAVMCNLRGAKIRPLAEAVLEIAQQP